MDWPHVTRQEASIAKTALHWTPEGRPPQDHVATDSVERNQGDGEDLGTHQAYGKVPADVEGVRCCPTCQSGVKAHELVSE